MSMSAKPSGPAAQNLSDLLFSQQLLTGTYQTHVHYGAKSYHWKQPIRNAYKQQRNSYVMGCFTSYHCRNSHRQRTDLQAKVRLPAFTRQVTT